MAWSSLSVRQDRLRSFRAVFDFDIVFSAITATCLAVVDQSNSCTLIGQFGLIAVVSYDFVLCNTWRLSSSQGKVATMIRCGGLLLC